MWGVDGRLGTIPSSLPPFPLLSFTSDVKIFANIGLKFLAIMAKNLRRAAKKVMNSRDGHGLLGLLIFDEKLVYENFQKMVNTKANASLSMLKWAKNEENLALQDAFSKVFEVSGMWASVMRDFNEEYHKYRRSFKEVLREERCLDEARKREAMHATRLNRLQKQLDQTKRKSDIGRPRAISNEMAEVITQAEHEQAELEVKATQHEIFKARKLRDSLIQVADGLEQWASKTLLVAGAYKRLADLIPDTPTQLTQDKLFHGAGQSRTIVNNLGRDLHIDTDFIAQLAVMGQSPQPYLYAVSPPTKQDSAKYCYVDSAPVHKPAKANAKNDKGSRAPQPLPRQNLQIKESLLEDQNFRRPLSLNDLRPPPTSPPPPVPKKPLLFPRTSSDSTVKEKGRKISAPAIPSRPKQPSGKLWYARTNRLSSDSDSEEYAEPLPDGTIFDENKRVVTRVLSDGALHEPYAGRDPTTPPNGDNNYYHKLEWSQSAGNTCVEEPEGASYVDLIN